MAKPVRTKATASKKGKKVGNLTIPSIMKPHWCPQKTLYQNYQALGLMSRVNGIAGGANIPKSSHTIKLSESEIISSNEWNNLDGGYGSMKLKATGGASLQLDGEGSLERGVIERDENGKITSIKITRCEPESTSHEVVKGTRPDVEP